jgi:hypothetical protein
MNTEKHAAEVLLDRGVSWPVPAPWYLKIIGKKKIWLTLRALKLGTLLELSRLYVAMGIKEKEAEKNIHATIGNNLETVCLITAISILNSRTRIRLFSKPLANFIMKRFTANMLLEVMIFITTYSGVTSFLNTIRLIGDLRMTAPKNLSPESQGSQQK